MHSSISIHIYAPLVTSSSPRDSASAIALDECIERYTGLTPADMAAHIHSLCGDLHLDREAVAQSLRSYGGAREDVAQALTDLFGDDRAELAPEARRLRAALIRFTACVLDGIVASDPSPEI